MKKILLFLCFVLLLTSCTNTEVVETKNEPVELEPGVYEVVNPHTYSTLVCNEKGEILIKLDKGGYAGSLRIVEDAETKEPMCIAKVTQSEEKQTNSHEENGETYTYDYLPCTCELFDLNGNSIPFDGENISYIDMGYGDNIFYFNYNNGGDEKYAYNIKTYEKKKLDCDYFSFQGGKMFFSDYFYKDNAPNRKFHIMDKDLNIVKTINDYTFDSIVDYNGKKTIRVATLSEAKNITMFNYLDDDYNLILDTPTEENIVNKDANLRENLRDEEYNEILSKLKEKYSSINFVSKKVYNDKAFYIADYVIEPNNNDNNDEDEGYEYGKYLFDENLNLCFTEDDDVQEFFNKIGLILINCDTFYDTDMNVVKKFDNKSNWVFEEKFGKNFLFNKYDEKYEMNKTFNLYDENFNVLLSDLTDINVYMMDDYIVTDDEEGTKLYDKDLNKVKDYKRHVEIFGWNNDGINYFSFLDKDTGLRGVMNENYDIILDGLKSADYLKKDYFTYQKGFEYGLMDYNGNVLLKFPIFDNISDEEERYSDNMSENNYPRVDGSTANMPMMARIRSSYLGEDLETSESMVDVSTTDFAWRKLVDGAADLLLVYEPSSETKAIIENSDVKLKVTPIGVDALVFIENKNNQVDNLTTDDLVGIYSGDITNWSEVGGEDKKIEPFQRPLNSGSQTLFLNLLMKDKAPMDAKKAYRPEGMGDLIETVASYKNEANAIGYSVYYYASKMYNNDDLKLISVDGVMPNDESIANKTYPFTNDYYLVVREDANEETMKLYDFILSDMGKQAIKDSGYIPVE